MNLKECHNFNDFRKLAKKKLPSPTISLLKEILISWSSKLILFIENTSEFLIQNSEAPFVAIKLKAPMSLRFLLKRKSTISNEQTNPSNKSLISLVEKGALEILISSFILKAISGSINGLENFLEEITFGSIAKNLENKLP